MQNQELLLELAALRDRVELAEQEINRLKNPMPKQWLSTGEAEEFSRGKWGSKFIRDAVHEALERPADSQLHLGVHYIVSKGESGRKSILINYPEFDRIMLARMREIAFV